MTDEKKAKREEIVAEAMAYTELAKELVMPMFPPHYCVALVAWDPLAKENEVVRLFISTVPPEKVIEQLQTFGSPPEEGVETLFVGASDGVAH